MISGNGLLSLSKKVCCCSRECFHIPYNTIMSYQQLCYRLLWEERERVNQTTECRLISAQGTWERCFRCLLKVGHTEQTTSMSIYTSYPAQKKCTAKSKALLHCKYQLSVLMYCSDGHSIHNSFHVWERQRL